MSRLAILIVVALGLGALLAAFVMAARDDTIPDRMRMVSQVTGLRQNLLAMHEGKGGLKAADMMRAFPPQMVHEGGVRHVEGGPLVVGPLPDGKGFRMEFQGVTPATCARLAVIDFGRRPGAYLTVRRGSHVQEGPMPLPDQEADGACGHQPSGSWLGGLLRAAGDYLSPPEKADLVFDVAP